MGYDVFLAPKTRSCTKKARIVEKINEEEAFLSRDFAMFHSRPHAFAQSELVQIEALLHIDLTPYWSYPINYEPDTQELEYEIYLAEEANDLTKIPDLKQQIIQVQKEWEVNYDSIHEGWTHISQMRETTLTFLEKIRQNPSFGSQITEVTERPFDWGRYFISLYSADEPEIVHDLRKILLSLDYMEEENIDYVALVGY
ncbi:hypothetical protein QNI19_37720 [Cytophagaceae bacterium DM2B3-1]|uniref:DUF695 domain-containing protein n=1 Tax=Xanthocytophaga flava TaxID=3048013 RepID=A0ABT7CYA5_9BACT|nr:hypothetical protein [Xanthocytophaga flavus]MDJ1466791.1 hypothetical protein [Xanthocytophaga flavus]MDJ1498732.1 hypothetical protein [Xanthocytophaga flavus]